MKNKFIFSFIVVLGFIVSIAVNLILWHQSERLQGLVDRQNIIMDNYANVDSLLGKGQMDLVDAINNFFSDVPTYKDGKQVNAIDFIHYHNRMLDSLNYYKDLYNHSKNRYGINVDKIWSSDSTSYHIGSKKYSKADSSKMLYEYFKDRLVKNTDGSWTILTGTYGEEYTKLISDFKDVANRYSASQNDHIEVLKNYNQLIKDYNKEIADNRDLLKKLEKNGVIKIDSLESGGLSITYEIKVKEEIK